MSKQPSPQRATGAEERPIRVVVVMPVGDRRGGAERMLAHLLDANRTQTSVVFLPVFFEDGTMVEQVRAWGYRARVMEVGRLRQVVRYAKAVWTLARILREERADLVLSWISRAHLYAGPAALLARIPAVWFQFGMPHPERRRNPVEHRATRIPAALVLCCSHAVAEAQRSLSPERRTAVLYPTVDLEEFDPSRLPAPVLARRKLGLPEDRQIVGIVARMQAWKGVHVFVEAAARVREHRQDVHFVVVGGTVAKEPDYPASLRRRARELGLEPHITFAGHQTRVAEWVQAMDILVHASTRPEPFGIVLLEGLALGKLVLATGAGGPLEILEHAPDQLVPLDDVGALSDALSYWLDHPEERTARAHAARERAEQFGKERLAGEAARILASVLR